MLAETQLPPALPGSVLVRTLPEASTAAHSDAVGQETPFSAVWPSIAARGVQASAPSAGAGLVTAPPSPSTAAQGPPGTHEIASSDWPGSTGPSPQAGTGAVGSVLVMTLPPRSTATHSASEGHEIALGG